MNAAVEDEPKRSHKDLVWVWLCWLGVAVVLYILSTGPLVMLVDKKLIRHNTTIEKFLVIVYWPLNWASTHTPFRRPLGMYWHLCAPGLFDTKGNPK